MAYLKGGTYVDGDVFVEGKFQVRQVTLESGQSIPSLAPKNRKEQFLVNFNDSLGTQLIGSSLESFIDIVDYKPGQEEVYDNYSKAHTEGGEIKSVLNLSSADYTINDCPDTFALRFQREADEDDGKKRDIIYITRRVLEKDAITGENTITKRATMTTEIDADCIDVVDAPLYLWDDPTVKDNIADYKWHYTKQKEDKKQTS